jgi:hypothetical protein
MEENKPVKTGAGESLSEQQATSVAGGDATATVSVGTNTSVGVTNTATDVSTALIGIYEGFVDVTSHVIERVVNAVKN